MAPDISLSKSRSCVIDQCNIANSGQSSLPPLSGTPQTKPLLGSLTSTPQPQQSLNIFGASQNQAGNNQQQQGGGLFGNQATAQATGGGILGSSHIQKSAGSLFGNNPTQQSQPQQTGGPFGPSLGQSLGLNQARPQQQQLGGFLGSLGQSPGQNQAQQPQNNIFGGTSNQNKTLLLFVYLEYIYSSFDNFLEKQLLTVIQWKYSNSATFKSTECPAFHILQFHWPAHSAAANSTRRKN